MEDIESGLVALRQEILSRNIRSIAIPPLGSGLGGLDWGQVRCQIEAHLSSLTDVRVVIFEPSAVSAETRANRSTNVPKMTPGRAALVGLMNRYLSGLLDPFITLLEVHKLMYFMQCAGEPLRLKYAKGLYGPYAENLRHVLKAVEGHLISGYADGGDAPGKQLKLVPGALEESITFLADRPDTHSRLDRVSDLVDGFESPFGLELLSTAHWLVSVEDVRSVEEVVKQTYAWNDRKKQFSRRQIVLAYDVLVHKGWIRDLQ